jgi:peroxiredoxin
MLRAAGPAAQPSKPDRATAVAQTILDFELTDTAGRKVALADFRDKQAVVVVFTGTQCPIAQFYAVRLCEMQRELAPLGVQFLAVFSNAQDSADDVARYAQERKLPFPALSDPGQKVADRFGAKRTPEAFLLDANGVVRYRGQIDDRYGVGADRGGPTRNDLQEAIAELLAGKAVRVPCTRVAGCIIGRAIPKAAAEPVTYTKHVASILQNKCQECHRPGQVAPFALLTYEAARDWSAMIREVVTEGRMPPWHADPKHGKFLNDRSLSESERKLLLMWIEQGCVQGDTKDLPGPRVFSAGWLIGTPDAVLTMPRVFDVPAIAPKGGIPYQHFVLETNFEADVFVKAVQLEPGNRAVVHHMIVFIGDAPAETRGTTADRNVLAGWVPGSKAAKFPDGLGVRIPKGAKLTLEMHYTANGTAQSDRSSIGLVVSKQRPRHEVRSRFILNDKFKIPAGTANHEVTASTTFEKDAVILVMTPHMHLRGKDFLVRAVYPDGRRDILLSVPKYDFNWQHGYILKDPLPVPAGTRIECVAHFDNSPDNPNNPDPTQEVRWGDQSWEEMMLGVIGYIYPRD